MCMDEVLDSRCGAPSDTVTLEIVFFAGLVRVKTMASLTCTVALSSLERDQRHGNYNFLCGKDFEGCWHSAQEEG